MSDDRPLRIRSAPHFVLLVLTFGALWVASDALRGRDVDVVAALVTGVWFVVLMVLITRWRARRAERRAAAATGEPSGTAGPAR